MFTASDLTQPTTIRPARRHPEDWAENRTPNKPHPAILGDSEAMQRLRMQVRLLGPHFRIVLLHGEAGTGKELAARSLHAHSSHAAGPFVRFDCDDNDATADELRKALKAAHRGTIYLPQIGAMQRDTQAALLATLQGRERVLPNRIVVHGLEARVVASSIEDLRATVAGGSLLQELHRRISSVTIELPALRERAEDIPDLAQHFLESSGLNDQEDLNELCHSVLSQRIDHSWPGNVKELKRLMQQAVEACHTSGRDTQRFTMTDSAPLDVPVTSADSAVRLQDVVERHILHVLKECSGNKVRAAEMLGISRSTLYRMLEAGLQGDKFVGLR